MINYYQNDIIKLTFSEPTIIMHICNVVNGWGAGFVKSLSSRWQEPEKEFRKELYPKLGQVQFVLVEPNVIVANMFAQKFIRRNQFEPSAVDLSALTTCLYQVVRKAQENNAIIVSPKIGAGLAGEKWENIEKILEQFEVSFNVYTI